MGPVRFKAPPQLSRAFYLCTTRLAGRLFLFDDEVKDQLVAFVRLQEGFTGVRVLAYCVMSDHYHLLLAEPERPENPLTDEELIARVRRLPGHNQVDRYQERLATFRGEGKWEEVEALRRQLLARMYNVGTFMKELNQRISRWYNRSHRRRGALWEARFQSVVVEGAGPLPATASAYIDLNPVRADLVDDPRDYRWCSYAEAMDGGGGAREGLRRVMSAARETELSVPDALAAYREALFGSPDEPSGFGGKPGRPRLTASELPRMIAERGELALPDFLRLRVRYFTEGMVLGRRRYLEAVFRAERRRFGPARWSGARPFRFLQRMDHYAMRDLHLNLLGRYVGQKD